MPSSEISAAQRMLAILQKTRFLASVTLQEPDDWRGLGQIIEEGGLGGIEILLRSAHAWAGLRQLRKAWPDLILGVGTVLSLDDLARAQQEGADFAVSPGTQSDLLKAATQLNFPYLPGGSTASDLMSIVAEGYLAVKLFPAEPLGLAYLQALAAPFADLRFCLSGGINASNYRRFLVLPQLAALSGSWALPTRLADAQVRAQALPSLKSLVGELNQALNV